MMLQGNQVGDVAELRSRPWGSEVRLELTALPSDATMVAIAIGPDGMQEQVATWSGTTTGRIRVVGASSLAADEIVEVRIDTTEGEQLRSLERDQPT